LACLGALSVSGCFSTDFSDQDASTGGGSADDDDASDGSDGSGGTPSTELCDVTLDAPQLALFFLAERSVDMGATFGSQTEWAAQYEALEGFFADEASAGIVMGGTGLASCHRRRVRSGHVRG